jgi:hypothetical protein
MTYHKAASIGRLFARRGNFHFPSARPAQESQTSFPGAKKFCFYGEPTKRAGFHQYRAHFARLSLRPDEMINIMKGLHHIVAIVAFQ